MRRTGKSKTCVWRWQERFMKEGIDGLLPRLFSGWRIRLIAMRQCASETGTGIFSR
jgi:transposase